MNTTAISRLNLILFWKRPWRKETAQLRRIRHHVVATIEFLCNEIDILEKRLKGDPS